VWTDTTSGAKTQRPQLDAVLDALRPGDSLVVWRIDRLGRSLPHLIETVTALGDRGIHFRSLTEGFDTTTAGGEFLFHIMAALAQMERRMIVERTHAGLAAARARGRTGGRPAALTG
ncbi:recombinase family protein, partial [Bacillus tropicus]|uniref:recombinase family protein n=1 Tax=Bacillus tropicus TaxID=2026188 RepID=UPI003D0281A5